MNLKLKLEKLHEYAQDNVGTIIVAGLIGAYIGGAIVAKMAYKQGQSDLAFKLLNDLTKH